MSQQTNHVIEAEPAGQVALDNWISEINDAARNSSGWIIETGLLLLRAKEQLIHGQWLALWETRRTHFGLRTAEMLMRIARHPTLRDPKNISNLPVSWCILYVLSQLPVDVVEREIAQGAIHVELKLAGAQRLVSRCQSGEASPPSGEATQLFDVTRQKSRFLHSLRQRSARWPAEHRLELAHILETVAAELRQGGNRS